MKRLTSRRLAAWLVVLPCSSPSRSPSSAPRPQQPGRSRSTDSFQRPTRVVKNPRLGLAARQGRGAAVSGSHTGTSRRPSAAASTPRTTESESSSSRHGAGAQAAIVAAGGTVEAAAGGLVEALVPAAGLDALSRSRGVALVRAPLHAVALGTESQGVAATSASAWHAAGATGVGAKVAVIDLGFAGYTTRQAAGELPAGLITQDYCGGSMGAPEPHGTAVAEIVHEMAPGAQLYLICIDTEVDLRQRQGIREGERDHDRQPLRRLVQLGPRRRQRRPRRHRTGSSPTPAPTASSGSTRPATRRSSTGAARSPTRTATRPRLAQFCRATTETRSSSPPARRSAAS